MNIELRRQLEASLPEIIARREAPRLLGGVVAAGTLANEDCRGTGPAGAFRIAGRVVYPRESLLDWLESRSGEIQRRGEKQA